MPGDAYAGENGDSKVRGSVKGHKPLNYFITSHVELDRIMRKSNRLTAAVWLRRHLSAPQNSLQLSFAAVLLKGF